MKVSEWLRQYQLTGKVPEEKDAALAFWCGWMIGPHSLVETRFPDRIDLAIKAAEFIEEHSHEA